MSHGDQVTLPKTLHGDPHSGSRSSTGVGEFLGLVKSSPCKIAVSSTVTSRFVLPGEEIATLSIGSSQVSYSRPVFPLLLKRAQDIRVKRGRE